MDDSGHRRQGPERSPEIDAAILAKIADGSTQTDAAQAVGIHRTTLSRWKSADPELAEAMERAESEAKAKLLQLVLSSAGGEDPDWRAAAWILERRWPDEFGPKARMQISVDVRGEAETLAARLGVPVDELLREADQLAQDELRGSR